MMMSSTNDVQYNIVYAQNMGCREMEMKNCCMKERAMYYMGEKMVLGRLFLDDGDDSLIV